MDQALADQLVMLAELQVKPERLDEFLEYTVANLPVSRAHPGNLQFDMLLDAAEPTTVRFYEVWESAAAQQAYMAWRTDQGDLETLLALLAAPPKFKALRAVE